MSRTNTLVLSSLETAGTTNNDDSSVSNIAQNIQRFSNLYKDFLVSEIKEDIEKVNVQAEKIKKLQDPEGKTKDTPEKDRTGKK